MRYTCITVIRVAVCRSHKAGAMGSDFSESALLFAKEGCMIECHWSGQLTYWHAYIHALQ